ncbi:MAG TPA: hypothetical protein DCW68_00510 [Rhodospirillaceae bacterium]|nr:hypothetical protein [Rhodospirillaceae bacterium]
MRPLLLCLLFLSFLIPVHSVRAQNFDPGPVTADELDRFMVDYPAYCQFILENMGSPEEDHSSEIANRLANMGWDSDRYFHVLSAVTARIAERVGQTGMEDTLEQMRMDRNDLANSTNLLPDGEKTELLAEMDLELARPLSENDFDSGLTTAEKTLIDARIEPLAKLLGETGLDEDFPVLPAYGFEPPME